MPRERKTKIFDGYTVFQAARRAEDKEESPPEPSTSSHEAQAAEPKIGAHIARTVLPTKHDITCYECGFAFQLTGRAQTTFCPRCRSEISLEDHRIAGESTVDVKTGANVHIAEGAVVRGGTITANDVVLDGELDGGRLRVFRWLELGPAARFDPACAEAAHLRVRQEATINLSEIRFRDVEVSGALRAVLRADGLVTIKAGGVLEGELNGPRLTVEEGGGLKASVTIGEDHGE